MDASTGVKLIGDGKGGWLSHTRHRSNIDIEKWDMGFMLIP